MSHVETESQKFPYKHCISTVLDSQNNDESKSAMITKTCDHRNLELHSTHVGDNMITIHYQGSWSVMVKY